LYGALPPREWRKLYSEDLNDPYSSANIIQEIKSRRVRWDHVAFMGGEERRIEFWWGNMRDTDQLGDPGVDERIILRWIFGKWD
jgi:hypothetical protein